MNTLDRINNQLITYAYKIAGQIKLDCEGILNRIRDDQPKSNIPNKPLNISVYTDLVDNQVQQLKELEELSTKIYRYNQGLEKSL